MTAFGFDHVRRTGVDLATGFWPSVEEVVLEDTDETRIVRDGMGRRTKLSKGKATIALPLDFPVKTEADWARMKSHYRFDEARFAYGWADRARAARGDGARRGRGDRRPVERPRGLRRNERSARRAEHHRRVYRPVLSRRLGWGRPRVSWPTRHPPADR